MWWCHWTCHTWFPIDMYNNYMSNSHRLALIAAQKVFSHVSPRKKNHFFFENEKPTGHTAQGKPQLKFERNPCNNFRDNRRHRPTTDGRRTTDEFRFHELCWHSQAELKMRRFKDWQILESMSESWKTSFFSYNFVPIPIKYLFLFLPVFCENYNCKFICLTIAQVSCGHTCTYVTQHLEKKNV